MEFVRDVMEMNWGALININSRYLGDECDAILKEGLYACRWSRKLLSFANVIKVNCCFERFWEK